MRMSHLLSRGFPSFARRLLVGLSFLALAPVAHAEPQAWVGGLLGLSIPNADDTSARPIYGITGGAKLGSEYGIGAYYLTSQKEEDVAGAKSSFDVDLYGVEVAYHFEGEAKGVYLGGRLGTSKVRVGASGNTHSTSPFHWGLVAGYNHMLGENFSLGGEANVMSVASSKYTSTLGLERTIDGFTMLNFMATAKLWF